MLRVALLLAGLVAAESVAHEAFPRAGRRVYFAVSVADLDKSARWYEATLGLKRLDDTRAPDGAWRIVNLTSEDIWIELIQDRRDHGVERARGIAKVGFAVDDVDEVATRAEALGLPRPRVVESSKHRIRVVQLTDPDGNILQFMSALSPEPTTP